MPHQTVLLEAAVEALNIKPDGVYIDATFGRGGHSAAVLHRLGPAGRMFALDQDPQAIAAAQIRFAGESRFVIEHGSFANLNEFCQHWGVAGRVDGLLFDLGVSSPQLDDAERGFSFMRDGPLDMRMNNAAGMTAAEWLNSAAQDEIATVLWQLGEERFSRRIAAAIVETRIEQPFTTTLQLARVVAAAVPRKDKHKHPATRSFQAIRIFINRELDVLEQVLTQSVDLLKVGGRLVVISFHSLEDRVVKNFVREKSTQVRVPRRMPVNVERSLRWHVVGKPVRASEQETMRNPRARSAIMRIAELLA
ncbi:MAG: 16S rRNA (cytosine(1402)-N(4))-methyltransferase RsmH [Gammaproteobacteria bacterium]|nr:16S rRNA (cytosine(1402)-N(4))-methyltransferase RsmH [Gammaproteobacteria bacterium]